LGPSILMQAWYPVQQGHCLDTVVLVCMTNDTESKNARKYCKEQHLLILYLPALINNRIHRPH
jgi:hypothetical protein